MMRPRSNSSRTVAIYSAMFVSFKVRKNPLLYRADIKGYTEMPIVVVEKSATDLRSPSSSVIRLELSKVAEISMTCIVLKNIVLNRPCVIIMMTL